MSEIWDEKKMRLKFLFFPIMLVVSVAIFIGYIWPALGNIKKINEDRIEKTKEMQLVKEKQAAIELIGKKISDNVEGESVVNSYLPETRVEEQIIGGINYLAGDANVSLINISLEEAKKDPGATIAAVSDSQIAATLTGAVDPLTGQNVPDNANLTQTTSVKISLVGEYAKIKMFLDNLQRMPIFNTVKAVSITKQKSEEVKAVETDAAAAVGEGVVDSSLAAEIEVDFGYLNVARINSQQVEGFSAELDNETVSSLRGYISQKSQAIGNEGAIKGKANPFLAN